MSINNEEFYRNDPFAKDHDTSKMKRKENHKNIYFPKIKISSSLEGNAHQNHRALIKTNAHDIMRRYVKALTLSASAEVPGGVLAVESNIPLVTSNKVQAKQKLDNTYSFLASFDLNLFYEDGRPLLVSLHADKDSSSMSLSQALTFDRNVYNLFEERCFQIRNTIGWSCQWKKKHSFHKGGNDDEPAQISAGLAWQINRGACIKVVTKPNSRQEENKMTLALILKRWKEPGATCSLLFGTNTSSGSIIGFKGIGLELETGAATWQNSNDELFATQDSASHINTAKNIDTKVSVSVPPR
jgi:hypothetical protein